MTTPSWYPDEILNAGGEHLDPDYVQTYDRKAGTDPAADLALITELGLNESATLVDFGAGTGTFTLAAAPHCHRVIAIDVSPAMVAALKTKINAAGVTNVRPVLAGFLSYEHEGDPADFVYSRHALHHLPDFWKAVAFKRIAEILKPGGILRFSDLVYSFELGETNSAIENWLSYAAQDTRDGWTRSELDTHLRTEFSTFSWLLEPMVERAGFKIRDAWHHESGIFSAYTCVKV